VRPSSEPIPQAADGPIWLEATGALGLRALRIKGSCRLDRKAFPDQPTAAGCSPAVQAFWDLSQPVSETLAGEKIG